VNARKLLPVLVLACGLLSAQSAQPPEPILKSAGQPTYPPLARAAHIEGEVPGAPSKPGSLGRGFFRQTRTVGRPGAHR